jgi:16S rRNA (guanine527-N7)-methyltransferase
MDTNKKIETYVNSLKEYNETTNIYSKGAYDKLEFHIADCIQLASLVTNENLNVLDIGSGSGLPAVIVAIINPNNNVTAVESKSRKTNFLELIKDKLQLDNLTVIQEDINQHVKTSHKVDIVTTKAFGSLEKILKVLGGLKTPPRELYVPISANQVTDYKSKGINSIITKDNESNTFHYLHYKFK